MAGGRVGIVSSSGKSGRRAYPPTFLHTLKRPKSS